MQMASLLQGKMKHRRWKMQEKAINMMLKRGCYWKKKRGWVKRINHFANDRKMVSHQKSWRVMYEYLES